MFASLALRLAAIELLNGATIAGHSVFDSRQDQMDGLTDEEARPVLSVYTEDDHAKPYGSGRTQANESHVWLVIEGAVVIKGSTEITHPDGSVEVLSGVGVPLTDGRHEALVDILDAQVRRRLQGRDLDAATVLFRRIAAAIEEIESFPQRTADKASRIAARTIRARVKVPHDVWPAGASGLPEPLATVAAGLTLASSLAVVAGIASLLAPAATPTPLAGVDLTYTLGGQAP